MTTQACAVPLIELLRGVPLTARLLIEGHLSSQSIPVGRYCHEAADKLSSAPPVAIAHEAVDLLRKVAAKTIYVKRENRCVIDHDAVADVHRFLLAATPTASDRPVVRAEWISVDEREPEVDQEILLLTSKGVFSGKYRIMPFKSAINRAESRWREFDYWMPLPDAPADRAAPPSP